MSCVSTLICIGVGRDAMYEYATPDTFFLSKLLTGQSDGIVTGLADHHAKIVIAFETESIPNDAIKVLIAKYPFLRFVLYAEADSGERYILHGKQGVITKEGLRTDPPAWIKK